MPKRLNISQRALWEKASAFHWGMTMMACLGRPRWFDGWVRVPAGVDLIVFRVRGGDGGGEAEELGGLELAGGGWCWRSASWARVSGRTLVGKSWGWRVSRRKSVGVV